MNLPRLLVGACLALPLGAALCAPAACTTRGGTCVAGTLDRCDSPQDMWSRVNAGAADTSICPTVDEANKSPALNFGGGIISVGPFKQADAGDSCCYTLAFPCD